MTRGAVLIDVQGTQSIDHRDRGIARYTAELGNALWRRHPELVHSFLLNPDLGPPGRIEPLIASGRLAYSDRVDFEGSELLHICSPFELSVPMARLWLAEVARRRLPLVVTLHDTIPARYRERYLEDPGQRARYFARVELVRSARMVLTLGESVRDDAIADFGIREDRVHVIGGAPVPHYMPPASRPAAKAAARAALPGLAERFVMYTGGLDARKNFEGLFRAWALLALEVRAHTQLVMVCHVDAPTRNHLEHLAREAGILDDVLLTGFVSDDTLRLLYQATDLFVFPSLYEGYGLPVAEALACGAPTIGSDTSSVRELLSEPNARFDPTDDSAIATAIAHALAHPPAPPTKPLDTWGDVADRTAAAYEQVLTRPRLARRRRPLLAVVAPAPPAATGIAAYTFSLVRSLLRHYDVHVLADGERWVDDVPAGTPRVPDGAELRSLDAFIADPLVRDRYQAVLYCLGNSQFHGGALAALRLRSGVVHAHEVRLNDLYALAIDVPGAVPNGFQGALDDMYGDRLPPSIRALGRLPADVAERYGVLMAKEIVRLAERVGVASEFAAKLLRTDIDPSEERKIDVLPFAYDEPRADATLTAEREPVIGTFGVVNEVKQTALIIEAMPRVLARVPDATLAIVGRCGDEERVRLELLAGALGLQDRVTIVPDGADAEYRSWLDRARVGVQLRRSSNGECSAAIADCVSAGVPLVVTDIGAARDIPDGWAVKVDAAVDSAELADVIASLLTDATRREQMVAAGWEHARKRSVDVVADRLAELIAAPVTGG